MNCIFPENIGLYNIDVIPILSIYITFGYSFNFRWHIGKIINDCVQYTIFIVVLAYSLMQSPLFPAEFFLLPKKSNH